MSGQPRAQTEPLAQRIRLGMPQLCGQGLSEHWLLKTAGDLHWQALAATHGCRPSALQDAQGRRVYAAFTLVHLRSARLREVDEDQTLDLRIAHQPLGRSRHFSQQWAQGPQGEVAQLSLLTAAVVRERAGDNHTVARVPLPTGPMAADAALATAAQAADASVRAVRAQGWRERFALPTQAPLAELPALPELADWAVTPCPYNDFNGAGLLYFASFQALADRAHGHWGLHATERAAQGVVRERQMVFHGNVNPGEALRFRLRALRHTGLGHWSWTQVQRQSDGRCVADLATLRV